MIQWRPGSCPQTPPRLIMDRVSANGGNEPVAAMKTEITERSVMPDWLYILARALLVILLAYTAYVIAITLILYYMLAFSLYVKLSRRIEASFPPKVDSESAGAG